MYSITTISIVISIIIFTHNHAYMFSYTSIMEGNKFATGGGTIYAGFLLSQKSDKANMIQIYRHIL